MFKNYYIKVICAFIGNEWILLYKKNMLYFMSSFVSLQPATHRTAFRLMFMRDCEKKNLKRTTFLYVHEILCHA